MLYTVSLDKCIMACMYHSSITWSSFPPPGIFCAPPPHPSKSCLLWSFYYLHRFAFSRTFWGMYPSHVGLFDLLIGIWVFSVSFHGFIAHLFLALSTTLLSGYNTLYLTLHYPSPLYLTLHMSWLFSIMNKNAVDIHTKVFVWMYVVNSF